MVSTGPAVVLSSLALPRPAEAGKPGQLVEHVACPSDPSERYTLYLPSAYVAGRRWPLLFVFDPARVRGVPRNSSRVRPSVSAGRRGVGGFAQRPVERNEHAVTAMWPALMADTRSTPRASTPRGIPVVPRSRGWSRETAR